ncbi:ABC transporter permease [Actinomadura kijaniata]|uniref:ABC transporter permease n=1 Tax=Actinomadura kijaniata TaxID=46161 RepID=UPI003F19CC6A
MIAGVVRRVVGGIAVLLGSGTLAFAALRLIPGDPAATLLGGAPATPEAIARLNDELGLDRPLPVQYATFLGRAARGDLGWSFQYNAPVTEVLGQEIGPTARLTLTACALAAAGATALALLTAGRRVPRAISGTVELVGSSTPTFWLGIMLLTLAGFRADGIWLPALTLAVPVGAVLAQVLRDGLETALSSPFVLTARARGVADRRVRRAHALRHALIPALTVLGWTAGSLLAGAVVVESVFARPGVGRVAVEAVMAKDMPVVVGAVLLASVVYVVVNTLVDLAQLLVDPRLREV